MLVTVLIFDLPPATMTPVPPLGISMFGTLHPAKNKNEKISLSRHTQYERLWEFFIHSDFYSGCQPPPRRVIYLLSVPRFMAPPPRPYAASG